MRTNFSKKVPDGDTRLRDICNRCGHIDYQNPRVVVGSLPVDAHGHILLEQQGCEWGLPYDFMRVGETSKEGAARILGNTVAADVGPLLAFGELLQSGIVTMTFRTLAQPTATMQPFALNDARLALAGNPVALQALDVHEAAQGQSRVAPGFLSHSFNAAAKGAEQILRLAPETSCNPAKACGDCSFDKGPKVKIVPGVVAAFGDKILMAQRAIPPRVGFWAVPAGFMELGETLREGAAREALEETGADVDVGALLGLYEIPELGQVMPVFRGEMRTPDLDAGTESLDARLCTWTEIEAMVQNRQMAFMIVKDTLDRYKQSKNAAEIQPCHMRLPLCLPGKPEGPGIDL
ncbi:MAG: NUDIX domain-containing protein [Micavibrio aeruginosavorus]|nr:NUDIX domain-containing protein [Micavibrio aeruginosavorus]